MPASPVVAEPDQEVLHGHNDQIEESHRPGKGVLLLSLGALGVVYGDIGTSPLYALNLMFFGFTHVPLTSQNILG